MKITFLGAGSTGFAKNVMGDIMLCPVLCDAELALYDIDPVRMQESFTLIERMNNVINAGRATIKTYVGVENRREALQGADFVICCVQVGGYKPCTVIDFEVPKKYGLQQTIGDTMGIGGIFRALRTIPVLRDFAEDIEAVCPNALLLHYSNPMAMLSGFIQRFTNVKSVGLCHSVQVCAPRLLKALEIETPEQDPSIPAWDVDLNDPVWNEYKVTIAGINHMAWLLELRDKAGTDLLPEIRKRARAKTAAGKHDDMVRYDYIDKLGYYCTESSIHNSEYNPFYLKANRPDLLEKFNITPDDYLRRCEEQLTQWAKQYKELSSGASIQHKRSREYASRIMEAMVTNTPLKINGNVINRGSITNLPYDACVEVPCLVDASGVHPTYVGALPTQLAAMNSSNIYPQMLTIEAAVTHDREKVYQAAMMDPHTGAQLSTDEIVALCDDLIEAHTAAGFPVL